MREYGWFEIRIGDLGAVFTGRTPPTERAIYFGDDYPFITPGDMRQGKYARTTERSISHEGAELLKRIKVPANGVCVSCIGWQMGEAIMTDKPSFTNQQINTVVPNGKVDPSFLYYSLLPRKQELRSLGAATGVRAPILNKSAFCDLKVKIPPLPMQRRIAGILSAYDNLIENNQRRIKILEEMARSLYREWFVKFRFPGHEKVPLVDSAFGPIPRGWEVKPINYFGKVITGKTPSKDNEGFYGEEFRL
jgi:type I restriction enzyme S subunit